MEQYTEVKVAGDRNNPAYAKLSRRIGAVLVDSVLIGLALFAVIFLVSRLSIQSPFDLVLVGLVVGSIEPLLVALSGGSLGRHVYGLRIRRSDIDRPLGVIQSYFRFLVKLPLGFVSLVTVLTSRRHQSIHDLLCRSIVVHRNPERQPKENVLSERLDDQENYVYPGKVRRVLFILLYYIIVYLLISIAMAFLMGDRCLSVGRCSQYDSTIQLAGTVLFTVSIFVIAWLGWRGSLVGCRRKAHGDIA